MTKKNKILHTERSVYNSFKSFLSIILFLTLAENISAGQISLSLADCINAGLKSSRDILNAKLENDKNSFMKDEAAGKLFPQVEGFGTYENYLKTPVQMVPGEIFGQPGVTIPVSLYVKHNITAGFRATQTIYDQTSFLAISLSETLKELSAINLEKTKSGLIYDITRLYYLIRTTDEQILIFNENIARLDTLQKVSELQYKLGLIKSADAEQVKVNLENLVTEKNGLLNLRAGQLNMLLYITGTDLKPADVILSDPAEVPLKRSFVEDAAGEEGMDPESRPEIQLLMKQSEMALLNIKAAAAQYYPSLSLYAQYFYTGQREKFDFMAKGEQKWFNVGLVGLNLSVPVFDGFQKNARVNEADVSYNQALNDYEFTKRLYRVEYENALSSYRNSRETESRQNDNVKLAEKVYSNQVSMYRQGIISLSDVLSSENSLAAARLSRLNAIYQLRLSELEILKSTGNLKILMNQ